MYHPFSVAETFKTAWNLLKRNFAVITVFSITACVVVFVSAFVVYNLIDDSVLSTISFFVLLIEVSFMFLAFIKLMFRLMDMEYYDFDFSDIVPKIKTLLSYLSLLILVSGLVVFVTTFIDKIDNETARKLVGVVVGGIVQFFFLFYLPICTCFIVDDESGPFESVGQSLRLIRGNFLKYLVLFLLIEALIFIGSLTVIGVLIVYPFVNILLVVAYRKLVYSHQDIDDDVAETN